MRGVWPKTLIFVITLLCLNTLHYQPGAKSDWKAPDLTDPYHGIWGGEIRIQVWHEEKSNPKAEDSPSHHLPLHPDAVEWNLTKVGMAPKRGRAKLRQPSQHESTKNAKGVFGAPSFEMTIISNCDLDSKHILQWQSCLAGHHLLNMFREFRKTYLGIILLQGYELCYLNQTINK